MSRPFLYTLTVVWLVGCHETDVLVAQANPAAADAGEDKSCRVNGDCNGSDLFCAKSSCGDVTGVCQVAPSDCPDEPQEVCGCDGVTYWNVCLLQRDKVSASTPGPCQLDALPCDDATSCGVPDAFCDRVQFHGPCMPGGGFCHVLPDTCPTDQGTPVVACGPPGGGHKVCTSVCDAIRSEMPFTFDRMCR